MVSAYGGSKELVCTAVGTRAVRAAWLSVPAAVRVEIAMSYGIEDAKKSTIRVDGLNVTASVPV